MAPFFHGCLLLAPPPWITWDVTWSKMVEPGGARNILLCPVGNSSPAIPCLSQTRMATPILLWNTMHTMFSLWLKLPLAEGAVQHTVYWNLESAQHFISLSIWGTPCLCLDYLIVICMCVGWWWNHHFGGPLEPFLFTSTWGTAKLIVCCYTAGVSNLFLARASYNFTHFHRPKIQFYNWVNVVLGSFFGISMI